MCAVLVLLGGPRPAAAQTPQWEPSRLTAPVPELAFQQGLLQFQSGEFGAALASFRAARPVGTAARFYEGLAASQLQRFDAAVEAFAAIEDADDLPDRYRLEYGVALVQAGRTRTGIAWLQKHAAAFPEDPEAAAQLELAEQRLAAAVVTASFEPIDAEHVIDAEDDTETDHGDESAHEHESEMSEAEYYLLTLPEEEPDPLRMSLLNSVEWDSNVILSPEFVGLGADRDRTDARHVIALFGDYAWVDDEELAMGFTGSLFNSSQFQLTEFNTLNVAGGVYALKPLSESLLIGTNYQYQYTQLNGELLASEHRVAINGTYHEDDFGYLTAYYEYDRNRINAPALIAAQERSANVHAIGLTQAVYLFEEGGIAYAGYRFAENNAEGDDFEFNSHMITGRVELPVFVSMTEPARTFLDAEVRIYFDDYDKPNSLDFRGRARDDTRTEVRVGAERAFSEGLSLRIDYTFINSESNVSNLFGVGFYDYDRHVISTQLICEF